MTTLFTLQYFISPTRPNQKRWEVANVSHEYFINGHRRSIEDILKIADSDLVIKIKAEGGKRAVLCNDEMFRQSKHGDCVVYTKKKEKEKNENN